MYFRSGRSTVDLLIKFAVLNATSVSTLSLFNNTINYLHNLLDKNKIWRYFLPVYFGEVPFQYQDIFDFLPQLRCDIITLF